MKVWYRPIGDIGTHAYPTYGFIYAGANAMARGAQAAAHGIEAGADRVLHRDDVTEN